jgi:hypothetical protein
MVHCTEELRGKGFRPLSAHSRRDRGPLALLITIIVLLGAGGRHMVGSLSAGLRRRLLGMDTPAMRWSSTSSWQDVSNAVGNGGLMLLRVVVFIAIATVVWLPIGAAIGLRSRFAEKVQPLAQLLADFSANLPFPIAAQLIVQFDLSPVIWLSPLMILSDFREAIASFRIAD